MEGGKKIDLDAPLLSTRRFSTEPPSSSSSSSTPFTRSSNSNSGSTKTVQRRSSLPFYKPDLKSGPIRNPGVVPFLWEQKPGQPKPGTGSSSPSRPPLAAPRPPPAKLGSSVRTRKPVTGSANSVKEPIDPSIENFNPTKNENFKEELELKKDEKFDQHSVPERIQATSNNRTKKDESNQKENLKQKLTEEKEKQEKRTQTQQEKQNEKSSEAKSESESEEDSFSDALDTLSRTESFVMNCSISGLSELPKTNNHLPGGSDLEAHKFMMDRFLPAAQAVAIGSPQYTFRKVPVPGKEPSRPFLTGTGTSPDQRRVPVPLPYQHQPKYEDEEEDEEEEDEEEDGEEDLEASRRFQAKGCGFFPSFCMKSSLILMNPVPGLKSSGKSVRTKGGTVKRNGSPLIRSSINGGAGLKDSDEAFETYMHSWEPVYKHKQDQTNNNINNQKKKDETKKKNSDMSLLTYWSDSQNTRDGSSPLLHSVGSNGEDPISKAAASPVLHSNGDDPISRNGSGSLDPDRFVDAQDSNPKEETDQIDSSMSAFQERESVVISGFQERESVVISGFQERESVVMSGFQERESVVMSGFQERENGVKLGFQERESGVKSGFQERESVVLSGFHARESGVASGFEKRESVLMSGFQARESGVASGFEERESGVKSRFEERECVGKKVESRVSLPLPLPVPKSPSESWLSRTLPSVGAKKQPAPSFLGMQTKKQGEERWRA